MKLFVFIGLLVAVRGDFVFPKVSQEEWELFKVN